MYGDIYCTVHIRRTLLTLLSLLRRLDCLKRLDSLVCLKTLNCFRCLGRLRCLDCLRGLRSLGYLKCLGCLTSYVHGTIYVPIHTVPAANISEFSEFSESQIVATSFPGSTPLSRWRGGEGPGTHRYDTHVHADWSEDIDILSRS